MAEEIFKRVEKKYLLDKDKYEKLITKLDEHMKRDKFFDSEIISLYYDTPDYALIRRSMEKPVFKEKIRLRSYGVADKNSTVFLEYKRKYKGVVYKRRTVMPLSDALNLTTGKAFKPHNVQIENELKYAFKYYKDLAPRMMISYHRHAYSGIQDPNLRITFDDRITYRGYDLDLKAGIYGRQLLSEGEKIMEIKIPGAMPLWLSHILDELRIYPYSMSKYGTAYTRLMMSGELHGKDRFANEYAAGFQIAI